MCKSLEEIKTVGIIGLGLIGGSIAKAIKQNTECMVYGYDIQDTIVKKAVLVGAIDEKLTDSILAQCDVTIVALYPQAAIDFVKEKAAIFRKGSMVVDCAGVKGRICKELEPVAENHGFLFMGGHPMAGLEHSGFAYSKKALFNNASMILTPASGTPIADVDTVKKLFLKLGFTNIVICTPEEHDEKIAFTSQLAHVVSSAYVKSPTAMQHKGFSAGSYKDMTRVAKLKEDMWAELFLENPSALAGEIDHIIERLAEYSAVIRSGNLETLTALLRDGKEKKMLIDGEKF